jgi:predicted dehydrogenase/threonine dehydrogenase-like Zn-dependent dehydrogenase
MKQLLQRLDTGESTIADVPVPTVSGSDLLVRTRASVLSAGTERMLVEFGRANLLQKAVSQPDRLRQVIDKVRTDGIAATAASVRTKLDVPITLGYCNAGEIVDIGGAAASFRVGERVVTNGPHAEYARVPSLLAARIPAAVSDEAAAFTPLAAIGLQGMRLAAPELGETMVVYGLGLIGLLTVQLLRANGCRVIGIDRDPNRLALAERFGAVVLDGGRTDVVAGVLSRTGDVGADAVLLTLASDSDEPVDDAARMSRKRGRIVLVGVSGLRLKRDSFYKRELSFAVSCSYGPGRYDPQYENAGQDYPLGYVRWTAARNFEAVLALMESGGLDPLPLVTHRFRFAAAADAYNVIAGTEASLGVVLTYPEGEGAPRRERLILRSEVRAPLGSATSSCVAAVVGAGNYATNTLLPVLRSAGVRLRIIVSPGGTSGAIAGQKFGFEEVSSRLEDALADPEVNTVFLLTRHDSHARLAIRALEAGKHVFVEKPLALSEPDLEAVSEALMASGRLLTVGFNRRFAPLSKRLREYLSGRSGPASLVITVNAGAIPREHWTQDPEQGGGRIIGEACHFIDLARALVGAPIADLQVLTAQDRRGQPIDDIAHLTLGFTDGSTAVVNYLSSGSKAFPKEEILSFFDGATARLDNWRRLQRFGIPGPWRDARTGMDKGHRAEIAAWLEAIRAGTMPIPLDELMDVSRWSIRAGLLSRDRGASW